MVGTVMGFLVLAGTLVITRTGSMAIRVPGFMALAGLAAALAVMAVQDLGVAGPVLEAALALAAVAAGCMAAACLPAAAAVAAGRQAGLAGAIPVNL
jgi:hypothetical protein